MDIPRGANSVDPVESLTEKSEDPFLRNVSVWRNEAKCRFDCAMWYDDGWVSSSVDFMITDEELATASSVESFVAERRGEAREKLKNAVICLQRLLPPKPEPEITWITSASGSIYSTYVLTPERV